MNVGAGGMLLAGMGVSAGVTSCGGTMAGVGWRARAGGNVVNGKCVEQVGWGWQHPNGK